MVDIKKFQILYTTKAGSQEMIVKAFNKQQAKRKLMSMVSQRRDIPHINNIQLVATAA